MKLLLLISCVLIVSCSTTKTDYAREKHFERVHPFGAWYGKNYYGAKKDTVYVKSSGDTVIITSVYNTVIVSKQK